MSDYPNADIMGQSVQIAGDEWIVVATCEEDRDFVILENEDERTKICQAYIVRASIDGKLVGS